METKGQQKSYDNYTANMKRYQKERNRKRFLILFCMVSVTMTMIGLVAIEQVQYETAIALQGLFSSVIGFAGSKRKGEFE